MKLETKKFFNDIFIFILLFVLSEIFFRSFVFIDKVIYSLDIIFDLGFSAILSFMLLLFKPQKRKWIGFGTLLLFDIYLLGQAAHELFFGDFFSITKITIIKELLKVKGSTLSSFDISLILFLFPPIVYILLYKYVHKVKERKTSTLIATLLTGLVILFGTSCALNYQYSLLKPEDRYGPAGRFVKMTEHVQYIKHFGIPQYLYKDISEAINWKIKANSFNSNDFNNMNKLIEEYSSINNNEYTSMFEGKNIIMVLCESLTPSAIDKELTPTLYKIQNEGINFNNHYTPLYEYNTADSEFISLTGMLPSIDYGIVNYSFAQNSYPGALPTLFKNMGYSVNSYHSGTKDFYNRTIFHNNLGFNYFYDYMDLDLNLFNNHIWFMNWIDDEELFKGMLKNTDFDKPFFNFVISGSGHMPYRGRNELLENYEIVNSMSKYANLSEEAKMYYAAQMKLDQGIETLINELRDKNELNDTVIVLYSDHYPYGITDEGIQAEVVDATSNITKMKGTFIIYNSEVKPTNIQSLSSTFDIQPTLANLFNLDRKNWYTVGTDALDSKSEHYVLFKNYSVLFDGEYYQSSAEIENAYVKNKIDSIEKYGENILISNYYSSKAYKNKK